METMGVSGVALGASNANLRIFNFKPGDHVAVIPVGRHSYMRDAQMFIQTRVEFHDYHLR
jgi:hypothetical protein